MNFKTKLDEISRHEHAQKALCSLVDLIHQDMIEGKPIGYYVKEKASGVWAISKQLDALNEELNEVVMPSRCIQHFTKYPVFLDGFFLFRLTIVMSFNGVISPESEKDVLV